MSRLQIDEGILEDAIRQAREAGLLLNCEDAEDGPFWTSDVPEARAFAARLCHGCPIFDPLATGEIASTSAVARGAGLDRKVTRFALEELAAIGVVENDRIADEAEELVGTINWSLSGDDGAVIGRVIGDHERGGGWDEMWVYTPRPPRKGEEDPHPGIPIPTLRPTPPRVGTPHPDGAEVHQ